MTEQHNHIDAMTLAAFQSGRLGNKESAKVQAHLLNCAECLVMLSAVAEAEHELSQGRQPSFGQVVVKFLQDTVEIISRSADIIVLPMAPSAPVRSHGGILTSIARFQRRGDGMVVTVDVQRRHQGRADFRFSVYDDRDPLSRIRISALRDGVELNSVLTDKGRALLDEMPTGKYVMKFTRQGREIGEMFVDLLEG